MPAHRRLQLQVEHVSQTTVLVVGSGNIAMQVSLSLKSKECFVVHQEIYEKHDGRYDYIFLFGNFEIAGELFKNHLKEHGKFIFIEDENEDFIENQLLQKIIVIRAGNFSLWNIDELSEKILKTTFSTRAHKILDIRKKGVAAQKVAVKSPTPTKDQSNVQGKKIIKPGNQASNLRTGRSPVRKELQPVSPTARIPTVTKVLRFKAIIFLLILPLLFTAVIGTYFFLFLRDVNSIYLDFKTHIASSNWNAFKLDIKRAEGRLKEARNIYDISYKILIPFRDSSVMTETGNILKATDSLFTSSKEAIEFIDKFKIYSSDPFSSNQALTKEDFEKSQNSLDSMIMSLYEAKQKSENINLSFFPKASVVNTINGFLDKLVLVKSVYPFLEKFLFPGSAKTYLVLLQNNMELRPTGGFIGSFGLLGMENGKMLGFKIFDVYTADGQLKGYVEPPLAIRKYLSQPNFFLRDSNFDPDFAVSAVQAQWFLKKELNIDVDGTIGVNLFLLQNLLKITGPITLSDFGNETVSFDNFFFKAQGYIEKDFFPGSTGKKDFLTAVFNALLSKISTSGEIPFMDMLVLFRNSLEQKNALFYMNDQVFQETIEGAGWGGRMVNVSCVKNSDGNIPENCASDYLSIIEANLGVNKANYFVSKSETVEKKFASNGEIMTVLTIAYENSAQTEIFKGGNYLNYLRVYVPKDSKLVGATINNMPISLSEIDMESYFQDKSSFGMLVKIAPGNRATVRITYVLPYLLSVNYASYQFYFQKQPGDKISPFVLSLTYPVNFTLSPENFKSGTGNANEVYYTTDTSVDRIFSFGINK